MEQKNNPNMALWERYATPPQEALKPFNNGSFSGTDISPMWRIRCLTEEFGACGLGWYPEIVEHWQETVGDMVMTHVTIRLYVKYNGEWSKPISATGGNKALRKKGGIPSDECYKMAYTDALGGACKLLGIGGAVYWERGYSKYEDDYIGAPAAKPIKDVSREQKPDPKPKDEATTIEALNEPVEDTEFRILALKAYTPRQLDAACVRKLGTDFLHAPIAKLREMMPEEKLRERIAKNGDPIEG